MKQSQQKVLVAANPNSGRSSSRQRVADLSEAIRTVGFECNVVDKLEEVQRQSIALLAEGRLRGVVSAGGDGTADALANLLPRETPIVLFPLGTENLLAKHFGVTGDIQQAVSTIQRNESVRMDVGSANGKLFLVMLSCGFDAEVVRQMHAVRRGHINRFSYAGPIIRSLVNYRFPQLSYRIDDDDQPQQNAAWIFVFNVPRYAAGLAFCPQSDPHDGQLDVCTFSRSGILFGLGYFARLCMRSHQRMHGFRHQRCKNLEINVESKSIPNQEASLPFQIDGDPGGELPLKLEVLRDRLTVLRPPSDK